MSILAGVFIGGVEYAQGKAMFKSLELLSAAETLSP